MKQRSLRHPVAALLTACSLGCATHPDEPQDDAAEIVDNLRAAGFPEPEIEVTDDGVVFVGGDMEVGLEASREMAGIEAEGAAQFRHYRTNAIVSTDLLTICVDGSVLTGVMDTALDRAIAQFQSMDLEFDILRDDNPVFGCSAVITALSTGGVAGHAGAPSGGVPFPTITLGLGMVSQGEDAVTTTIMHELGHCLGFRHSDWFDSSISCGSGGSEGAQPSGAVWIPGTLTGGWEQSSVMNACPSEDIEGEWTSYDRIALDALFGNDTDDLVLRDTLGQVHYWPMNSGDILTRKRISGPVHGTWTLKDVGDVDGDGTDDIIWRHTGGQVHFWPVTGGTPGGGSNIGSPVLPVWTLAAVGDIDGDGTDDIIWQHDDGRVLYWKMSAGGVVSATLVAGPVAAAWTLEAAGDMDGDGTDDIVWRHDNGQVHYWPMRDGARDGTGIDISGPVSSAWVLVDTGDLNGDETDDILWRSTTAQLHYWAIRDGERAGAFDIGEPTNDALRIQAVGDLDPGPA